jgi:6-pyruvoyltetrahydropterin/6-carboxytetrahydropterin synthase
MQYITRSGTFDSGHRVMDERMKCFNLHGHTYLYELTFSFNTMEEIGYAIDFKEIKRVACQWIDDLLDHGFIANPQDTTYIDAAKKEGSKVWLMSLNGEWEYCNPSVENLAREIFLAMEILFEVYDDLKIHEIKLNETPKCYTVCNADSILEVERESFKEVNYEFIQKYAEEKGIEEYDNRKL